jgi:hypothetical protein
MATGLFDIEAGDLLRLRKFAKNAPAQFERVAIGVLNAAAFGTRTNALRELSSGLIIRNKAFLKRSVIVQKANTRSTLARAEATTGSVKRDRFTGWLEQQTGQASEKTRTSTIFGRGLNPFRVLALGNRLRRQNILNPDKFPGGTANQRSIAMINMLKRRNYTRTFIIKGNNKFKRGLYKFDSRRKVRAVQRFNNSPIKPKRLPWLTNARDKWLSSNPMRDVWAKNIKFVLKL